MSSEELGLQLWFCSASLATENVSAKRKKKRDMNKQGNQPPPERKVSQRPRPTFALSQTPFPPAHCVTPTTTAAARRRCPSRPRQDPERSVRNKRRKKEPSVSLSRSNPIESFSITSVHVHSASRVLPPKREHEAERSPPPPHFPAAKISGLSRATVRYHHHHKKRGPLAAAPAAAGG